MFTTKTLRHGEEQELEVEDLLTRRIVGAAIEVHRALGPGLLESAYEECLFLEISLRGLACRRQVAIPLDYKGVKLDCAYAAKLIVNEEVILRGATAHLYGTLGKEEGPADQLQHRGPKSGDTKTRSLERTLTH